MSHGEEGVLANGSHDNFTCNFLLVKVNESPCYVTQGWGEGLGKMTPNVTQGGGGKSVEKVSHII
jgi:hypothetical protein